MITAGQRGYINKQPAITLIYKYTDSNYIGLYMITASQRGYIYSSGDRDNRRREVEKTSEARPALELKRKMHLIKDIVRLFKKP
jgi:hypothetical protein